MSGGESGDDWHESLFKPEKGDSLGDGSWGRASDEPDLAPVAWDKLPEAPKNKVRARLATPAPGSQKESGLLDIKALAPDLAKSMKDEAASSASPRPPAPPSNAPAGARLATAAKGSAGSGLIDVQEIVRAQEQQETVEKSATDAALDALSESSGTMNADRLSSSLVDQPVISLPRDEPESSEAFEPTVPSRTPLYLMMGLLAVAVVGLALYALSQ